jgi:hypothetical protein
MTCLIQHPIDTYKQHKGSPMKNHNSEENKADAKVINKELLQLRQLKRQLNYIWTDGLDLFGRISALVTIVAWFVV